MPSCLEPVHRRRPYRVVMVRSGAAALAAALLALAACTATDRVTTPSPPGSPAASHRGVAPSESTAPSSSPEAAGTPTGTVAPASSPAASVPPDRPLASTGSIAVVGSDGSLSIVDASGESVELSAEDSTAGFPAWSPDGSRLASIGRRPDGNTIVVVEPDRAASGDPVESVVIFDNPDVGPFYLSWAPDGRSVAFLATESDGALALRQAPADGSAPLDGSGPEATIRTGDPFYFDWIERDRLLAHVGSGPDALLGEIGLDGDPSEPALGPPGLFRSAVVSRDGSFVSYVRLGDDAGSEVVVAARDGSSEQAVDVFGFAAVGFDPTGDTIATIGPIEPVQPSPAIPVGPLRLVDAGSGEERTILDGLVVGFWWSPDGRTIAALRLQPVAQEANAVRPAAAPAEPPQELRLLFVDVASGDVEHDAAVRPGELFIDQLLPFFDQYALSHHLWAPDSSSFLLPVVDEDRATRVAVMYRDGDPMVLLDGAIAFWTP